MSNVGPFDIFTNPNYFKESQEALIKLFSSRIKESFLRNMSKRILSEHPEILDYFDFKMTHENMLSGTLDNNVEYELCRNITSIHRYNCIGLSDYDRSRKEKEESYKNALIDQVLYQLKFRAIAASLFRKRPIVKGEDFAFYPPTYLLFMMTVLAEDILARKYRGPRRRLYSNYFNKLLAALTLIEDNLLDNAYPIARGAIELYIKLQVLLDAPEAQSRYDKFLEYELRKNCANGENPEEFMDEFQNRTKQEGGPVDYLHYGWVDEIRDYHALVDKKPYTIGGLFAYEIAKKGENPFTDILVLHTRCHAFTHGTMGQAKYPLLHYIDLTMMLLLTAYQVYCDLISEDSEADEPLYREIANRCSSELTKLIEVYESKSTETFETFYNYKK